MDGFDVLGVERCHDAGDDATPVSSLDDFDLSTRVLILIRRDGSSWKAYRISRSLDLT